MPCAKCHFKINSTLVANQGIFYVYLIMAFSVIVPFDCSRNLLNCSGSRYPIHILRRIRFKKAISLSLLSLKKQPPIPGGVCRRQPREYCKGAKISNAIDAEKFARAPFPAPLPGENPLAKSNRCLECQGLGNNHP